MTIPRFFIPITAIDHQAGKIDCQDMNLCKQVLAVLRLKPGDPLDFLDGLGHLYRSKLESAHKGHLRACIEESLKIEERQVTAIHIGLPLLKSGRFEWALEKLTELGVAKISPLVLRRSVVKPDLTMNQPESSNGSAKLSRWRSILKEAAEQCERGTIPHLVPPQTWESFLEETSLSGSDLLRIICAERTTSPHLSNILGNRTAALPAQVVIAIGAEGGFDPSELKAALDSGFIAASLGQRILRCETAAIYALAIVACQIATQE